MFLESDKVIFLMIDIQEKLAKAIFNRETVIKNATVLSKTAKNLNIDFFITEQYPQGLGETLVDLKTEKSVIFIKTDFDATKNKELANLIKDSGKTQIVLFGIETHICVYQTAMSFLELGYDVTLICNASGSRMESEHLSALNYIQNNGGKIKTTEMVIFELLKSSRHEKFKEIQGLIK